MGNADDAWGVDLPLEVTSQVCLRIPFYMGIKTHAVLCICMHDMLMLSCVEKLYLRRGCRGCLEDLAA